MAAINLLPYQKAWLKDKSRFKVGMMSRQIGKTFVATLELVLDCLEKESKGIRGRWVILSRGERQAKEAMSEGVKRHLQALEIGFESIGYQWSSEYYALEAILPGGSRITALPANPDTARGFSASVLADEFAFHANSSEIWRSLYPVISAGHSIRVISTPNGKSGQFYDLIAKENQWSKHIVDIYKAVRQGLPRNVEELKLGLNDDLAWRQEYLCQFVDEAHTWLPYDLIQTCEHEQAGDPGQYIGHPCFIGNDIARRGDRWVAWVLEKPRGTDVFWTREVVVLHKANFAEQDAEIARLFRKYRVIRMAMDRTGMGEKPVEDMQREYGEYRVEGVQFTNASKYELATIGKQAFERRRWRIPIENEIRDDFHKLKKTTTLIGAPRFDAEADETGHADRAWAGFLALYAAGEGYGGPIEFAAAGQTAATHYDDLDQMISNVGGVGAAGGQDFGGWM